MTEPRPSFSDPNALPRSTPEAEGVDSAGLLGFVEGLEQKIDAVHSVLVVRHGKVVLEGFWSPYAANDLHVLYSVSKSFASTAIGIAQQEGLLHVHDLVLPFFPELAPAQPAEHMKAMRIHDLLRMSSGHQNDANPVIKARADGQWVRAFLETDVENKPGTHWVYNSAASYMLCAIVQKVSGTTVEEYLRPRLFEPLGIERWFWCKSPEGITLGDGGLSLRSEHLAKFGLLYLQQGLWNGRRVLDAAYVDQASQRQTATGGNPAGNWDYGYGYQFWRCKGAGYRADGAFGQFSFIMPEHDAVVAVTSGTADMAGVMDSVWQHVLPALHGAALAPSTAALGRLHDKLATLALPVQRGEPSSERAASLSGRSYTCADNELGIRAVGIDFGPDGAVLRIADTDGQHQIECGAGRWVRARTSFQRRISNQFSAPEQGIAASGAWTERDVFSAKLCFHESPYTLTGRFTFAGEELFIDFEHNLRWGETRRPRITGQLGAAGLQAR
jgi:CubicO group peptidase (beta-lactamase class C family)